jgi:hypothetical protein
MRLATKVANDTKPTPDREHRLRRLIERLPSSWQSTVLWLRRPSSRWVRIPVGAALVAGGLMFFLPFLGIWMLPLGVMLLAQDMPPLRRACDRILDGVQRRRPHWFTRSETTTTTRTPQA